MRIFLKLIFTILVLFVGLWAWFVMKAIRVGGAIPNVALFSGILAALVAIWKYNPKRTKGTTDILKLDKDS